MPDMLKQPVSGSLLIESVWNGFKGPRRQLAGDFPSYMMA
jgi:hypothetical protein